MEIKPFVYQGVALDSINAHFSKNNTGLMVMATGLGKTITSALWAKSYVTKCNFLFLCHENRILDQSLIEYKKVMGNCVTYGIFNGEKKIHEEVDFLFASFQTMKDWKKKFGKKQFDIVIVDESHHGYAPTFKRVINYFQPKYLFGMTATPNRTDGKNIRKIFGQEIVNVSLAKAIAKGWLVNVEYHVLTSKMNEDALRDLMERSISLEDIDKKIFIKQKDEEISRIICEYRGKTIVFCQNVAHSEYFFKLLPNSYPYHSCRSTLENLRTYESFKSGQLTRILSINKFNEGIDVPNAEIIVFLRNTKSRIILEQQIGRGLRPYPGKTKVIILDFVVSIKRIKMLKEVLYSIKEESDKEDKKNKGEIQERERRNRRAIYISGENFKFAFSLEVFDLLEFIQKKSLYGTWQEASSVAIAAGITSYTEYRKRYKELDPKLPADVKQSYKNFPGWDIFLGRDAFCETWQEASEIAIKANITSGDDYKKKYKDLDAKLPGNSATFYEDFPGWIIFLGKEKKEFYETWQEASEIAIKENITSSADYKEKYKDLDDKLPATPNTFYNNFPGWYIFLGKEKKEFYETWQEASKIAIKVGIKTSQEYYDKYKYLDDNLPATPNCFYSNFPGWYIFLGKEKKEFYETWEQASNVVIRAEIKGVSEYNEKYKELDSKLPGSPYTFYENFPGWPIFLGRGKK